MTNPTPSPEAVEAAAVSWYEKKYGTKTFCLADAAVQTACRETVLPILESALPIELEKARARWEAELRERLEKRALNLLAEGQEQYALCGADGARTLTHDQTEGFSNRSTSKLKTKAERAAEKARFQALCEALEILGVDESATAANVRLHTIFEKGVQGG